jgi:hypothetical protein
LHYFDMGGDEQGEGVLILQHCRQPWPQADDWQPTVGVAGESGGRGAIRGLVQLGVECLDRARQGRQTRNRGKAGRQAFLEQAVKRALPGAVELVGVVMGGGGSAMRIGAQARRRVPRAAGPAFEADQ